MNSSDPSGETTQFASPQRQSPEQINADFAILSDDPIVRQLLHAIPAPCAILNAERQIVFPNHALMALLGAQDPLEVSGNRPGEALHCIHASERHQGCGTTRFCQACGAVNAILKSQTDGEDTQECLITQTNGKALDLLVKAKTVVIRSKKYTVFTAMDISHEKRRRALERIFFHDVLNTASALNGFSELIGTRPERDQRIIRNVRQLSKRLLKEIADQKELVAAESNELTVRPESLSSLRFVREVAETYSARPGGTTRRIETDASSNDATFRSDPVLLGRVLGNLIKNAVEASQESDVVTIGTRSSDHTVSFWVHNQYVVPEETRLQIFQCSFSTKGTGRGLGAYSAKLLTEQYLKGRISFTSHPGEGTTFTVAYPLDLV